MTEVDVDGVALRVRVDGEDGGPPLALLNSLGTDLDLWHRQIAALAGRYRVVRHDSRGHGGSQVPPSPYTIDRLGQDVVGILDALDVGRAHICGESLGGLVAQWLAIHHPDRVRRVVLANTAGRIGEPELWDERAAQVRAGGMAAVADAVVARFFSQSFRDAQPEVANEAAATLRATPAEGYIGSCLALRDADLRDEITAITAPTLVIAGRHDVATPPADSRRLTDAIPDARLVELDAAHLSNVEQPQRFTTELLAFLDEDDER